MVTDAIKDMKCYYLIVICSVCNIFGLLLGRAMANRQGWGLFSTCAIDKGEMVIEYVGELVRRNLSDIRERLYNSKVSCGCV